ncbi:MAG: hypothetical protein EP332_04080 [Bacteroidetes bacterium]|nr:MAG: hypothetical protein EP332_04080 [Bacteroidota bacterium]
MKKFLFLLFLGSAIPSFAKAETAVDSTLLEKADSLVIGRWELVNPGQAKLLKTMGELFLRAEIHFADRNKYSVPGEAHSWNWRISGAKLTLTDLDYEEFSEYKVSFSDSNTLNISIGTQTFSYKRKKE